VWQRVCLRYGGSGVFNNQFIANLLLSLLVKEY